ncbi:MAG: hypothetical protein WBL28_08035 [Methylotenera sp.]
MSNVKGVNTMLNIRYLLAFIFLAASNFSIAASTTEKEFHQKVTTTYNFEPHTLKGSELKVKSEQLDSFWSFVRTKPEGGLGLLRKELADPTNSAFFFYDGASLLLSISREKSDQELALRSIAKTDLRSVQHTDYLKNVHWFAVNGFDTREAAFRILAFPDFQSFIVEHVMMLGQNYSLIYMLFPMDESTFVNDLAKLLVTETDVRSQKSLLLALWYTVTPEGNAALKRFVEDSRNSSELKSYATSLVNRAHTTSTVSSDSEASLRARRKDVMRKPISNEALDEFESLTTELLSKQ